MSDFQRTRTGQVRVRVEVEEGRGPGGVTEVPFTWEQSLDEVDVRIPQPSHERLTRRSVPHFAVCASVLHMRVVMAPGVTAVFDVPLARRADGSESFWTTDDDGRTLHLVLAKAVVGEPWPAVFAACHNSNNSSDGGSVPEEDEEGDVEGARREMLLQRFQAEHPGFDFTDAQVAGSAPADPVAFMSHP